MFSISNLSQYNRVQPHRCQKGGQQTAVFDMVNPQTRTAELFCLALRKMPINHSMIVGLVNPEKLVADFRNVIHNRNKVNVNLLCRNNRHRD
jgi:hypothetical protein